MDLASPHFASENATERFEFIWMKRFEDGARSFAIDRFPEMTEDSIEAFTIRSIERRRAAREVAFEALELEAALEDGAVAHEDEASYPRPRRNRFRPEAVKYPRRGRGVAATRLRAIFTS